MVLCVLQTHKLANSLGRAWLYILDVVYCLDRYLFSEYTTIRDPQSSAEVRCVALAVCLLSMARLPQRMGQNTSAIQYA
jgi:hypothetical protein